MEFLGERGGEGSFGGSSDEASFLEVEKGLTGRVVIKGFDAEMAGDGEEEGDG
jgi:hypothetical protein